MMPTLQTVFVMEQALGHVTHARNLRSVVDGRTDITPMWLEIPFGVGGASRFVPFLRSNWSIRASWRARRGLHSALASRAHDALVFHTQVTSLFSVGLMRRIPSVISLDATPINYDQVGSYYGHRAAGRGPLDKGKYLLNHSAFHAAAGLVTWSEWARQSLIDDYAVDPGLIRVLAPGAAPAFFEIGAQKQALHQPSSRMRILFVGSDFERKGGTVLLDTFTGALADKAELHLVTKHPISPRPNVFVYPDLRPNSARLLDLFATADVFVLPSYAECLAVVLMEATAAGLPVVTTCVGALGEAVEPGQSGLVISPGSAHELRGALEVLLGDAPRRSRMGRAGFDIAQRKFHSQRNNHALLDLVVEVAASNSASRRAA